LLTLYTNLFIKMRRNYLIIFLLLLLPPGLSHAQDMDSKMLRDKLIMLRKSGGVSPSQQLKQLLTYEAASAFSPYRNDSVRVLLLEYIYKLYLNNTQSTRALYYALKAINIVANNLNSPAINHAYQIKNYYNLAVAYDSLKKTTDKIKAYDSCITVAKRLKIVNLYSLYSLLEKLKYQNNIGDYDLCISQANLGETFSGQYITQNKNQWFNDSISYSLAFTIQKANALLSLHKGDDAAALLLSKMKTCNSRTADEFMGVLNEQLAMAKTQQKNYQEALRYYKQALKYYKKQKDTLSYKDNIHNIGFLYDDNYKNYDSALYFYHSAIEIKVVGSGRSKLDSINSLNIYSNIGNVFAHRLQFDSAQHYFQCAFNLIKKGTNESEVLQSSLDDFISNQKVEYITGLFINKGSAFYNQYLTTKNPVFVYEAIRMYKITDRLLERIKSNQLEIQSKLFWRRNTHPIYEQAIEACIKAGKSEDAFYFFERSRAILLYDQIKEQRGIDEADILKQQELRDDITSLRQQSDNLEPGSVDYKIAQNNISDLKDKQRNLLQQIKVKNPLYFSNFLDTAFTGLNDIRRSILKDHTLIEIFSGDSIVYSMIVTAKEIYFNRINKAAYDSAIYQCLSYISNPALTNSKSRFNSFVKKSSHLYNLVIQNKNLPDDKVIFSTDGHYFPFETLVIDSVAEGPVYFIEKYAVSYTYSARYLMGQFSGNPTLIPGNFLGVAPVSFPAKNLLSVLPGSDKAIKEEASFFAVSNILLNKNATKKSFLKNFGLYQVIQLYSHSSDSSVRGEPVIYFADEPLYLSELNNIKTPATRLVILSACETGKGELFQGEGVFSFSRAFAALGVPSCINNLWSVENEATYKLTNLFYKYLSEGFAVDEALRLAKLAFIKTSSAKNRMPYFWAAAIVAGKAEAIPFKDKPNHILIITVVITIAAFILLLLIRIIQSKALSHQLSVVRR